ncbi:MAG: hypothetical protein ICV87_07635 [Gemmatimonadetes bacterium]|nr:hypothetical protein [Gemmatimonadota bacterium]
MQQSGSGGPGGQGNMQGNMQKIGEGLGGLMGQAADNALGMFGAMMNNMGGWWAQAGNAQHQGGGSVQASFNSDADNRYRGHFEAHTQGSSQGGTQAGGSAQGGMQGGAQAGMQGGAQARTRSYDDVRPLYHFGHMASQNPDYSGRGFHEVEPELQRHWGSEQSQRHGSWPEVRGFVEFGYSGSKSGGASSGGAGAQGGSSGGVSGNVNASGGTTGGSSGGGSGGFHASGSIDTTRGSGSTGP